jgi:selenocysteine lyase/cysteine desulfurase
MFRVSASFRRLRAAFDPVPGYLNAATLGLPPRPTVLALQEELRRWQSGTADAAGFDALVTSGRASFARLVGVGAESVAVGSQVSALLAPVACSVPDGAEVLVPDGDFTSVMFPFMVHADRGVRVRHVPLEVLADQIGPSTHLVAFSLAQSADGRLADSGAIVEAAARHGALTVCDTTQAAGWLPIRAGAFDVTVCAGYKWLCCPRGVAFATLRRSVIEAMRPIAAGWYAGESIWDSIYGPAMHLAADARRFDVSPAWLAWAGAAPALELFAGAEAADLHAHGVGLAARVREEVGSPQTGSPVVSLADPDGALYQALLAAGCTMARRAGRVRLAFHVWNDEADVDLVLKAVRS